MLCCTYRCCHCAEAAAACFLQDAYDWSNARVILDVGGGRGELLSSAMSWSGAHCKGVLLDRQMVIDRCEGVKNVIPVQKYRNIQKNSAGSATTYTGQHQLPLPVLACPAGMRGKAEAADADLYMLLQCQLDCCNPVELLQWCGATNIHKPY